MGWPLVAAILGGGVILAKKNEMKNIIDGPNPPSTSPFPAGWRRLTQAEAKALPASASAYARERIQAPGNVGTFTTRDLGEGRYGALTEWHYHPPYGPVKPWGWHRGITILVPA